MTDDLFKEQLIDLAQHPHYYGELPDPDLVVEATNASCGDKVTFFIKLDEDKRISDIRWTGVGCIISQAAADFFAGYLRANSLRLNDIKTLNQQVMLSGLQLSEISMGRIKCLMLPMSAFNQAKRGDQLV